MPLHIFFTDKSFLVLRGVSCYRFEWVMHTLQKELLRFVWVRIPFIGSERETHSGHSSPIALCESSSAKPIIPKIVVRLKELNNNKRISNKTGGQRARSHWETL
ncbi:hypothetical protein ECG_08581 [Echinococcus granulosus]|nr:hypothetical protein ECG_08581 [Echinococcus granulosus]